MGIDSGSWESLVVELNLSLSEADGNLRAEYREKAQQSCRARPSTSPRLQDDHDSEANVGIGLLGLGDKDHAISSALFEECASQKGFVEQQSQEWSKAHSEVVGGGAIEPQACDEKTCTSFCQFGGLLGVDKEVFRRMQNLMRNICRSLKPLYKTIQQCIGPDARFPLLFARWVRADGKVAQEIGWLLTHAMFRPFRVDGINLRFEGRDDFLESPYIVHLAVEHIASSETKVFKFSCMDGIAAQMSRLKPVDERKAGNGWVEYAFRPDYSICWSDSLCKLRLLGVLNWIKASDALQSQHEESDDDNDIDQENRDNESLDEIAKMVANLTGFDPTAPALKPKPRPKPKSQKQENARGRSNAASAISGSLSA